jgi:hypothetical protein
MTVAGVQASMMLEGSMDALAFEAWVAQALVPVLMAGMVVFSANSPSGAVLCARMDNVNFHLGPRVRALIEAAGCVLAYLPTYSPDLNAIEEAISKIKGRLRRLKPRDFRGLRRGLLEALRSVSGSDVLAWMAHAGYQVVT